MVKELKRRRENLQFSFEFCRTACARLDLDHRQYRLYDLRTAHATLLLEKGAPAWYIDMLQGRASAKLLMQHYNAAEMKKLYNQWFLPALREPVMRLLEEQGTSP